MKYLFLGVHLIAGSLLFAQRAQSIWLGSTSPIIYAQTEKHPDQRIQKVMYRAEGSQQSAWKGASEVPMGAILYAAFAAGKIRGYRDKDLSQPIPKSELPNAKYGFDTITVIDPATYETDTRIIPRDLSPDNFGDVRLHLELDLHHDGSLWQGVKAASIVAAGNFRSGTPIYFPVAQKNKKLVLTNPNWGMVCRVQSEVSLRDVRVLQHSPASTTKMIGQLADLVRETKGENFLGADSDNPMTAGEIEGLAATIDTIVLINPDTYASEEVIRRRYSFEERLSKIRLIQLWAWDSNKSELVISPVGYAPISNQFNLKGELDYSFVEFKWFASWYR